MKAKVERYKLASNSKYVLSRAAHKFSDVLSSVCCDSIYRVKVYTMPATDEEIEKYGQEIKVRCGASNVDGKLIGVILEINTQENVLRASDKFLTEGSRAASLEKVRDALYKFIGELDQFELSISTVTFDVCEKFREVYCKESIEEPGHVDLDFSFYDQDYAGIAELNDFFKKK